MTSVSARQVVERSHGSLFGKGAQASTGKRGGRGGRERPSQIQRFYFVLNVVALAETVAPMKRFFSPSLCFFLVLNKNKI
jgi:hypothetical protein